MNSDEEAGAIRRLVGVYNADGTVSGEMRYWIGARLGRAHCSLCDITHGLLKEKAEWKDCASGLPVEFDAYHRNDMPEAARRVVTELPVVLAECDDGYRVLVDATSLDNCEGDPSALIDTIEAAVQAHGLRWQ